MIAPLAIAVAPNGARRTQADHPALPMTPDELAATAVACREAGACMLHLHVRDDAGAHSLDAGRYREALAAIRAAVGDGLVLQVTTEAVGRYTPAEQRAVVRELRPEAVSLAVREAIPDAGEEAEARRFLHDCAEAGVAVQLILYDTDDLARWRDLRARGVIPAMPNGAAPNGAAPDGMADRLYVLGRYAEGLTAAPGDLLPFVTAPDGRADRWSVCAFGPREAACVLTGAALGGHVRVGFENNLHLPDGGLAPDNAALVAAVATGAKALGRPLASAADLRAALHGAR